MVAEGRVDLLNFLMGCDWVEKVMPSEANFILLRVQNADALVAWCADTGIRIRNFTTQPQLQGCVRLTIGSPQEMKRLKAALQAYGEQL